MSRRLGPDPVARRRVGPAAAPSSLFRATASSQQRPYGVTERAPVVPSLRLASDAGAGIVPCPVDTAFLDQ
jgi:hypothetical protein